MVKNSKAKSVARTRRTARLSRHVRPSTIDLHFDLDPDKRTFRGEAGYVEDVTPGIFSAPSWSATADGGRVWTVELHSPGSVALRVRLRGSWGYDGLELRVYDPVSGHAFGPYQSPRLDENGDWWTTAIFGESIGLEFYQPDDDNPGRPPVLPELTAVAKHWGDQLGCFLR